MVRHVAAVVDDHVERPVRRRDLLHPCLVVLVGHDRVHARAVERRLVENVDAENLRAGEVFLPQRERLSAGRVVASADADLEDADGLVAEIAEVAFIDRSEVVHGDLVASVPPADLGHRLPPARRPVNPFALHCGATLTHARAFLAVTRAVCSLCTGGALPPPLWGRVGEGGRCY